LLESKTAEFVDEELKPYIGFMMEFVERAQLEKSLDKIDAGMYQGKCIFLF
jgi:hypothetical protein